MKPSVKISILLENEAKKDVPGKVFLGQHGLSLLVEAHCRVLFDTGPSDALIHNASLMGIDLDTIDCIALSHGHYDHADGLPYLHTKGRKVPLVAHPGIFVDRYRASGGYIGMAMEQGVLENRFDLTLTRKPCPVCEDILFLGEIPRKNDFEAKETPFFLYRDGKKEKDFLPDDSALAVKTPSGIIVVTGCSHAGICNIVEYAKEVCGDDRVRVVIGGFHLIEKSDVLEKTIAYFMENPVGDLFPMHCTGREALSRFEETFGSQKLCAGDTLDIQ